MIRILLEQSGYRVATAGTIADALGLAEADGFDFYLLDNWITDGEGIELCRQLRALYPACLVLFYSGVAHESEIEKANAAGADGYLVKPCEFELLQSTIAGLLKKKEQDALVSQSQELVRTSRLLLVDSKRGNRKAQRLKKEKGYEAT
jgi:DNA-binding response OmpR family regulator